MIHIIGSALAMAYGALTAAAAWRGATSPPLQPWARRAYLAASVGLIATGAAAIVAPRGAWWGVLVCLLAVQVSAINAGYRMHGRPQWSHHAIRLGLTAAILVLIAL